MVNRFHKIQKEQSESGFSLIEVLVIVIIIGVLFAIAAPGWLAFMGGRRATASRDQILQMIKTAQADAIRTRTPRRVDFQEDFPPSVSMSGSIGQTGQIVEILGNGEFKEGMITLEPEVPFVRFESNGTLDPNTDLPVTITVRASTGAERCVIVETLLGATRTGSGAVECAP